MERINEIEARMGEIATLLDNPEADLDALEAEVRSLEAKKAEIIEKAEQRAALIDNVNKFGTVSAVTPKETKMENEKRMTIESVEYRNAWLKDQQGRLVDEEEKRAYAASDNNNAIPTIVANKFFEKMKKLAPMLSEITLMQVAGNLKFIAEGTRNAAAKHTENQTVSAANDTIVSVTLGSYEFVKLVQISRNAENMSVDAFENFLVEMLSGDIARAIDNYIINDASNGIAAGTYTTGTNQILNTATTGYTYKNVCDLIALLPAAYDAEAKFLVNKKTLYGPIAAICDTTGRPIFVESTEAGVQGRIMGYPVVVDDYVTTANGALYLGKWTDVVGNLSQGITVDRDASAGFASNSIMYRGTAAFDSKVAKNDAIVRMVTTA